MSPLHKLAVLTAAGVILLTGCAPASPSRDDAAWAACIEYQEGNPPMRVTDADGDRVPTFKPDATCEEYLDQVGRDWFNARWVDGNVPPRTCAGEFATETCPPLD